MQKVCVAHKCVCTCVHVCGYRMCVHTYERVRAEAGQHATGMKLQVFSLSKKESHEGYGREGGG